ncbi:MAG: hypothetical protein ABIV51_01490 [Saprospiraceae bacterium]
MSSDPNVRDTFIDIMGIHILEPMAVLTDLIVSAVCLYCFFKLKNTMKGQAPFIRLYAIFFLVMSITTFLGGWFGHAFLDRISIAWKLPGWLSSMIAIGFAERAAIMHANPYFRPRLGRFISWFNIFEIAFFVIITLITLEFKYVEMHVIYGLLLIVFSFETLVYIKSRDRGSRLVQYGIGVAVIMGLVHVLKLSPHKWFNYLDLAHVFMAIALYVIYLGVKKMMIVPDFVIINEEIFDRPEVAASPELKS